MKKHFSVVAAAATLSAGLLIGCTTTNVATEATAADTVVFGKIYTSNAKRDYAEAFAVKDGKYVYVGSAAGVKKFIKDGTTTVLDNRGKGLVMAGATEGHGHYVVAATLASKGFMMTEHAGSEKEIAAYLKKHIAKNPNAKLYYTFGWDNQRMLTTKDKIDMRAALDKVCPDKIVIMMDDSGHNAFLNSKAIKAAGLTAKTKIEGGFIAKNKDGRLLGLVSDLASNYVVAEVIAKSELLTSEDFAHSLKYCEDHLHSLGYTNYFDALSSFFGEATFKGISDYDKTTGLTVNIGASYKVDTFNNIDQTIQRAYEYKNSYTTKHFNPSSIKLFADGECVESYSGWVKLPYKDGSTGTQVWPTKTFNYIVKTANAKGLAVHTHASGDAAVEQAVNAYILSEPTSKAELHNCIGHTRNVTEATKDLMAKHDIYTATNICWRLGYRAALPDLWTKIDRDFFLDGYPLKSMIRRGIVLSSSTDFPANTGAPCDIASIVEIAVNGTLDPNLIPQDAIFSYDSKEFLTVEETLDVLTINGAKQLGIEKDRGSVEVGKYADFLFLATDITTAPKNEIHKGKVTTVYFEGKKVFEK